MGGRRVQRTAGAGGDTDEGRGRSGPGGTDARGADRKAGRALRPRRAADHRRARPPLPGVQAHRRKGEQSNAERLLLQGRPLRGARRVVTRSPLRRRTEHRLAAGVAGGVADRLNASAAFVRVILFFAIAWAPWGLEAYAAAALLIPPRGSDRPDWDNVIG